MKHLEETVPQSSFPAKIEKSLLVYSSQIQEETNAAAMSCVSNAPAASQTHFPRIVSVVQEEERVAFQAHYLPQAALVTDEAV